MENRSTEAVTQIEGSDAVAINAGGWGVFFVWVGIALMTDIGWGPALVGAGIISLSAQAARKLFVLKVDWWGTVIGTCMVLAGLTVWFDIPLSLASLPSWFVPGIFVVLGLSILTSVWFRWHKG
jgi:hypothetical protein